MLARLGLLIAAAIAVVAFFLPFLRARDVGISARDAMTRVEEDPSLCAPRLTRGADLPFEECTHGQAPHHRSFIPLYFLAAIAIALVGGVVLAWPRLGVLASISLLAGVVEAGAWLRERRVQGHLEIGATLLAISGLVAIAASIGVLLQREPPPAPRKPPPAPPPPDIPIARVIER